MCVRLIRPFISTPVLLLSFAASAYAQETPPPEGTSAQQTMVPEGTPEPAAPKPPPYSLPWQLRPVMPVNVVRSDTAFAFYENPAGDSGTTIASTLLASYKVTPDLAPLVRLGLVSNSPPEVEGGPDSAVALMNPVIGATYGLKLPSSMRVGFFLGVALPFGSGGGEDRNVDAYAAQAAGIAARSAMDNAMFAVNYLTVFPGVDFAYIDHGFTAQAEATLLQLTRVRGDEKIETDESRTNLTLGLHLGYFLIPQLSVGAELRHQRWLSTPAMVEAASARRDTTTVAIGPRAHFKLTDTLWFRPGIALALPLDEPLTDSKHKIVQLDLPFPF